MNPAVERGGEGKKNLSRNIGRKVGRQLCKGSIRENKTLRRTDVLERLRKMDVG